MTYLFMRTAAASLVGAAALASQSLCAQETPVFASLPQDHEFTSAGYPLTGYGQSVAIQGNMALVGVPLFTQEDANGNFLPAGLVELYESDSTGTTWTRTGSLLSPDPTHQRQFGTQIGLSGKCLVVGSDGTIQLFERRRHQWEPSGVIGLTPVDRTEQPSQNLALRGNILAFASFGGPTTSSSGTQTSPFVYIYQVDEGCKPHLSQRVAALSGDTGAFGTAVALGDHRLVVGSPGGYNDNAPPGQAYVYRHEGNHWVLEQLLQSPTGAANSAFGTGVAIGHRAILVGAPNEDSTFDGEFTSAAGELYVFRRAHGVWAETQETRPAGGPFNQFGMIIATGGSRVAVGAPAPTDVRGDGFGPTFVYRWEGDALVFDNQINNFMAASLDVDRNRVIIGENIDLRFGFFSQAAVLTYPSADGSTAVATDDD
jgi:FG-GAP repeat protein